MVQYKAGYKFVNGGLHAQVLDFPEAITCGADLDDARRMLGMALLDMVETRLELGESLPQPNPAVTDPEMDVEEPLYLHLSASSAMCQQPAGWWCREARGPAPPSAAARLPASSGAGTIGVSEPGE